jgi:sterol desaturase/sphingolipid hydroxylase (fatty acid hydroxylase superfamily)
MFLVESLFQYRDSKLPRSKRVFFHSALALLNSILLKFTLAAPLIWFIANTSEKGWGLANLLNLTGLTHLLLTILVLDFFDYWWHRFSHQVPFLWRFHKVHHSDTQVDITTSLRFHPCEFILSHCQKFLWVILWGPSIEAFLIFEMGITIANQFHHANIRFPSRLDRILRWVIITPTYHAAHHTVDKETSDNTFATIFIWWDRLFGTYRDPDKIIKTEPLGIGSFETTVLSPINVLQQPFLKA